MKKIISALLLIGFLTQANAAEKNQSDHKGEQKKAAVYHIEQASMQSTLKYDGDAILLFGICSYNTLPVKVQLISGNTSLMTANYNTQSINDGFNLRQIPAGTYTLRITHGSEIIEKQFVKTTESAPIFEY
ncbi:MAG: hypothetical protein K9I36_12085 [Bacteroidia bacterium]|nr:hypothetical protein [Bacteroidia bacterium]MCF8427465.1 hypothetical protein [Bacteroidia bacterium]